MIFAVCLSHFVTYENNSLTIKIDQANTGKCLVGLTPVFSFPWYPFFWVTNRTNRRYPYSFSNRILVQNEQKRRKNETKEIFVRAYMTDIKYNHIHICSISAYVINYINLHEFCSVQFLL